MLAACMHSFLLGISRLSVRRLLLVSGEAGATFGILKLLFMRVTKVLRVRRCIESMHKEAALAEVAT